MRVLGLISGTSFDAIDAAVIEVGLDEQQIQLSVIRADSTPYRDEVQEAISQSLPPAQTTMEAVCQLDTAIGQEFASAAERVADGMSVDLVVSHGQTLFHWVEGGSPLGTLQLGQPAWIAEALGVPVVSDIRAADLAAGGHGAPLASSFDKWLLGGLEGGPRVSVNLGGISNLTLVDQTPPISYDAGPANALIDAAVWKISEGRRRADVGGTMAASGQIDERLLKALFDDPFYFLSPPKSTGKELFNTSYLDAILADQGQVPLPNNLLATLTAHAAEVLARDVRGKDFTEIVVSGGGLNNPSLMDEIAHRIHPIEVKGLSEFGIPPDQKEAVITAIHGWLGYLGVPSTLTSATGARHPAVLGTTTNAGQHPIERLVDSDAIPQRIIVRSGQV